MLFRIGYIDKLTQANTDLEGRIARLKELYDKAVQQGPLPELPAILPIKVDTALRALAQENADLMEYLPKYGMIKLKADLTFDKGSAVVKPGAAAVLNKLGEIANAPDARQFNVYVAGHTDDIPLEKAATIEKHGSNWGLSCHRALAVVQALAAAGVDQPRMAALGFSKYHPIAPNAEANRGNPLNRRVEIWIVPPDRLLTVSEAPEEIR